MIENLRLKRLLWAGIAAALAGDDHGLHALMRDLDQRDLKVIACAAIDMTAQVASDGGDRELLIEQFRQTLAETAGMPGLEEDDSR